MLEHISSLDSRCVALGSKALLSSLKLILELILFISFPFNGSPCDVDVKFLNMQSKMINNRCLFLAMKILATNEGRLRFFQPKSKEHTPNALFLNHFSHMFKCKRKCMYLFFIPLM